MYDSMAARVQKSSSLGLLQCSPPRRKLENAQLDGPRLSYKPREIKGKENETVT
jgi:hypothetical protein